MLTDTLEYLLRGLDKRERHVVTLRLQGCSVPEISIEVQRTERTVHRVLAQVRRHSRNGCACRGGTADGATAAPARYPPRVRIPTESDR